jgi:hypothetical protein
MQVPAAATAHSWDEQYRRYQATLTSQYLIPTLRSWSIDPSGKSILEIGCGDGGCGAELQRAGARVTALDIDARLVQISNDLNRREGVDVHAFVGDINDAHCPGLERGPFDLVLLRDVVEHLENLEHVLRIVVAHPPAASCSWISAYYRSGRIAICRGANSVPCRTIAAGIQLASAWFLRLVAGDSSANHEGAGCVIRLTPASSAWCDEFRCGSAGGIASAAVVQVALRTASAGSGVRWYARSNELLVTGAYFLLERDAGRWQRSIRILLIERYAALRRIGDGRCILESLQHAPGSVSSFRVHCRTFEQAARVRDAPELRV